MVDAARQMLDELMGRNRNLHPSEAPRKVNWDNQDFCQYYVVKFCPHELFVNTKADLGPCSLLHDDEARDLYIKAPPSIRKRQYEDDFLRFCNTMLHDVERKIQKGKQRLQLMNKDNPNGGPPLSKFQEQLYNLNGRIQKLVSEAEEAGTRGDVDQAQDLMNHMEKLKEERDILIRQHEAIKNSEGGASKGEQNPSVDMKTDTTSSHGPDGSEGAEVKPVVAPVSEKQMEVCEVCGAFLIVGDAQQRIEDHLTGKQHLGYSRLRKAVEEINEQRLKEREEEERKRQEEREQRSTSYNRDNERGRYSRDRDYRGGPRDRYRHDRTYERDRERHQRYRGGGGAGGGHDYNGRRFRDRQYDYREVDHNGHRSHSHSSGSSSRRDPYRRDSPERKSPSRSRSRSRSHHRRH